jgi:hypothetical protein
MRSQRVSDDGERNPIFDPKSVGLHMPITALPYSRA